MKFKRILLCTLFMIPLISFSMFNDNINDVDLAFRNQINGFFNLDSNGDSCYIVDSINNEKLIAENLKDSIKQCLVEEVERYIFKKSPKSNHGLPKIIVEHGLKHDIDIMFMMAQSQVETNYGSMGAGRESSRRSLFGVAIKRYNSYENATNDYCNILKRNYLTNGKTIDNLLRNYVTKHGVRYAEDERYEIVLSGAYMTINEKTNIRSLQNQYRDLNID